ncbi:hypothetical protein C0Q70_01639 [Pomacea canaliculata]|uniref:Uncharacterized protein n=1 Tax=Pomacea canaliculata TaxID=400727 RepID=A0A2T7Q015_POMCA|nr:hypothetical protein C0Q70_01639 [Pomacea canaliculata]
MTGAVKARDGDSVRLGDAREHEQTSKADQQKITFYEILESSLTSAACHLPFFHPAVMGERGREREEEGMRKLKAAPYLFQEVVSECYKLSEQEKEGGLDCQTLLSADLQMSHVTQWAPTKNPLHTG